MARPDDRIFHHDLCFGCGQANLFGLQLELEPRAGEVEGRFFVKQDHQGPPGFAHGGVIAAALDEAMALLLRAEEISALTARLEVDLRAPVPVGTYVWLRALVDERTERRVTLHAEARGDERLLLAEGRGIFVRDADQGAGGSAGAPS